MRLQAMLSSLPLFPFIAINVTALARHPSAIDARNAAGRWQCRPVMRRVG
jgi:muconolactone delta-isomerase